MLSNYTLSEVDIFSADLVNVVDIEVLYYVICDIYFTWCYITVNHVAKITYSEYILQYTFILLVYLDYYSS